jgi:hypothetical protein
MRIHHRFTVLALAVGMTSIGCMAEAPSSNAKTDDPTASQASDLTSAGAPGSRTPSDTVVWCSDKIWEITFWAEPEMIHPVGTMTCSCWAPEVVSGEESPWSSLDFEETCDNR